MPPAYLSLIPNVPLADLAINVTRSGLVLGDRVEVEPLEDGRMAAMALVRAPLLGVFPRPRQRRRIGTFPAAAARLLSEGLAHAAGHPEGLRLRIVGLTPEFLARPEVGAEVQVSVWLRV